MNESWIHDEPSASPGWQKTRRLARGLLIADIAPDDLNDQLTQLIEESKASGVICQLRQSGDVRLSDGAVAAQVFRIVQEALRNALKHAQAKHIDISIVGEVDATRIAIDDDGRGMTDQPSTGMGLRIMAHRASSIGARIDMQRVDGGGTRVVVHIPA